MRHLARKAIPAGPAWPVGSLGAALEQVPDPRHPYGWRRDRDPLPLVGVLQLSVAALLCGAQSLYAIAQWGRDRLEDAPELLRALGLPPGRSPSVATLHRLFAALDGVAFEQALSAWLATVGGQPAPSRPGRGTAPDAIAVDGKTLRGVHGEGVPGVHLVAAYAHQAQTVLCQLATAGKGHELAGVEQVLRQVEQVVGVAGRLVTGDALLTQRTLCVQLVEAKGHYLLPVKDNQPALLADCQALFSPLAGAGSGGRAGGPGPGGGVARRAGGRRRPAE
jgi:DDE_Tnp_1-associated/Transposase DDE domain